MQENKSIKIDDSDLEPERIVVEESDLPAESGEFSAKHLLDKLHELLLGRQIKILPESEPDDLDDIDELVRILSDEDMLEEIDIEIGIEPALRLAVTVQENVASAQFFFENLRAKTPELLEEIEVVPQHDDYTSKQWYSWLDLVGLANRWHIPLFIIAKNTNHWVLALRPPEAHGSGHRVLAYDPMQSGESWLNLPDWDPDQPTASLAFLNDLARDALETGSYDLSLYGDEETASSSAVVKAKETMVQLAGDGENCGPACLFMAALRTGVKDGVKKEWFGFGFAGRDKLKAETGLHVLLRDEIFGDVSQ